jgi:hypothetical protein
MCTHGLWEVGCTAHYGGATAPPAGVFTSWSECCAEPRASGLGCDASGFQPIMCSRVKVAGMHRRPCQPAAYSSSELVQSAGRAARVRWRPCGQTCAHIWPTRRQSRRGAAASCDCCARAQHGEYARKHPIPSVPSAQGRMALAHATQVHQQIKHARVVDDDAIHIDCGERQPGAREQAANIPDIFTTMSVRCRLPRRDSHSVPVMGDTWDPKPPSRSISASCSEIRSSDSVSPPSMVPMNMPSGCMGRRANRVRDRAYGVEQQEWYYLENVPHLREASGQIVDPMQAEAGEDGIERIGSKRQQLLVADGILNVAHVALLHSRRSAVRQAQQRAVRAGRTTLGARARTPWSRRSSVSDVSDMTSVPTKSRVKWRARCPEPAPMSSARPKLRRTSRMRSAICAATSSALRGAST